MSGRGRCPTTTRSRRRASTSRQPGVKVFAGQRQDPFYIDLGGVFDTFNFRRPVPALTAAEDANDDVNPFGVDMLSGFNVSTIALEVPAMMITGGSSTIGAYLAGRPRAQSQTGSASRSRSR